MEKKVIILQETLTKSILRDLVTFCSLSGILILNYFLLNNNKVTTFIFLIIWFLFVISRLKNIIEKDCKTFTNKNKAVKCVEDFFKKE